MASEWNSDELYLLFNVLGWIAFAAWAVCFYPQIYLNFRRKSVVGLSFDFVLLNFTKHSYYLIYNASVIWSPLVQKQYRQKHGANEMIPVAANDVAFSIHATSAQIVMLIQIAIYDRGNQKFSKIAMGIVGAAWAIIAVCTCIAIPDRSWLWLVSIFNTIQAGLTILKYIPQAYSNFKRKSTVGFSIFYVLLDVIGGTTNVLQMAVQSVDQKSMVNFYGNLGKTLISVATLFFDFIFMFQHFVLYRNHKGGDAAVTRTHDDSRPGDIEDSR